MSLNKNVAAICGSIILAGAAAGLPAVAGVFHAEDDHPHVSSALGSLHSARDELAKADGFRGHRDAAIKAVDIAISECETAMKMR